MGFCFLRMRVQFSLIIFLFYVRGGFVLFTYTLIFLAFQFISVLIRRLGAVSSFIFDLTLSFKFPIIFSTINFMIIMYNQSHTNEQITTKKQLPKVPSPHFIIGLQLGLNNECRYAQSIKFFHEKRGNIGRGVDMRIKKNLLNGINKMIFWFQKLPYYNNYILSMQQFRGDRLPNICSKSDLTELELFDSSTVIRAATAPSSPLSEIDDFRLSKKFTQLQQAVICSNQLLHKSFDKFDLDTPEGQEICQKYLNHVEQLCTAYEVQAVSRSYRQNFSQAYKVLYKEGELSYLTEILDSAQQGFPYLWVNGEKYSFSQEVLDHGSRLMIEFFKLQHCLRDFYGKLTQDSAMVALQTNINEIKENLLEFDASWSTFERLYVLQLMSIEVQARSLIAKAIEAEKCLTSVEIRQKMKGKILINCQDYLSTRAKLCQIISQINQIANYCGKGRDDLDHSILLETEGILRRITRDQSKAIRILGQKIRGSFASLRNLFRKYDKNIEMVDPQLKNNSDLVELLMDYEKSWEKGGNYFCDSQKKRHLLHFSGTIEGISQKYDRFKDMVECSDADVFLIIPCILTLKSLDKDDKNLCKYFLPNLHQIDTKTFRLYFQLQKQFQQWKRQAIQHYSYYNIIEKMIVGVELNEGQIQKFQSHKDLVFKIIAKIKNIGNELHRYNPNEWNSFMEICLAGSVGQ